MLFEPIALEWQVGHTSGPGAKPERFVPAAVPGAVQLDWAKAEGWGDHTFGDNPDQYGWMEDVYWLYRAPLSFGRLEAGQRVFFVCKGIDYRFGVRVNGRVLLEQEGMFTPVELDVTRAAARGGTLEVLIHPVPKSPSWRENRHQGSQAVKPAMSYRWDFHPRLVPSGIWDDAYLEVRSGCHIRDAEVFYELADGLGSADVRLEVALSQAAPGVLRWQLADPDGKVVAGASADTGKTALSLRATVDGPDLWWPNGQGDATLYTSTVELLEEGGAVVQARRSRVGFRSVRLVMHPDGWSGPSGYPRTRSDPPITLEINGRRVFGKGSNWVTPDIFPGRLTADIYSEQLRLARDADMNLLRCWGGAGIQKETFFELADELGIMLWQEFPLACNLYRGTPEYLRVLDQESRSIVRRLRHHPSVVLWCGGNELFNAWSRMTDQEPAIRLLNRNTYDLDPGRPFLPTSPVMGMAHGGYRFSSEGEGDVLASFARACHTAYTEFGCEGPAPAAKVRRLVPAEDLYPLPEGREPQTRRAKDAWPPSGRMRGAGVEEYFGAPATLEELCEKGQLLQGVGLQAIFEEARRQKPRCSMALSWCFNEPWPALTNQSIVSWPSDPKPAYERVKQALRPVLASARCGKFRWQEGEVFAPELWLLNDSPEAAPADRIVASLRFGDEEAFLLAWECPGSGPNANLAGPVLRHVLPKRDADRMALVLRADGHPEWNSEYFLLYSPVG
jgi:beta-mannosidase